MTFRFRNLLQINRIEDGIDGSGGAENRFIVNDFIYYKWQRLDADFLEVFDYFAGDKGVFYAAESQVGVEGSGFPFEAESDDGPVDVCMERHQVVGVFQSEPEYFGMTAAEGSRSGEGHFEFIETGQGFPQGFTNGFDGVFGSIAQKLHGQVHGLGFGPGDAAAEFLAEVVLDFRGQFFHFIRGLYGDEGSDYIIGHFNFRYGSRFGREIVEPAI